MTPKAVLQQGPQPAGCSYFRNEWEVKGEMLSTDIAASAPAAPLAGRRVLVVEDEYFIADDISRELISLGAEIIGPIAELKEAERILNGGATVDGALLDINLRSEMIFPLARFLRSRKVPFLFTTGYEKASLAPEFQDVPLFEKPLDLPMITRSLAAMMLK